MRKTHRPPSESPPLPNAPPAFFAAQVAEARRFHFPPAPTTAPLAVVSGGFELCLPEYLVDRTGFPYFAVEFVASGMGWLELAGRHYELVRGMVFSYGPGIPQRIGGSRDGNLAKYFLDFTGSQATALLQEAGLPPGAVMTTAEPRLVENLFAELVWTGTGHHHRAERATALCLERLLLLLAATPAAPETRSSHRSGQTFLACRRQLDALPLDRRVTLAEAARRCGVDQAHLCRLFARHAGQSPYQYLRGRRLAIAAKLLLRSGALIKEVAAETGFPSPFAFSRSFKAVYGISPEQFAARARQLPETVNQ